MKLAHFEIGKAKRSATAILIIFSLDSSLGVRCLYVLRCINISFLTRVRNISKSDCISFVTFMSLCPRVCPHVTTGWIFMKFGISIFSENLSRSFKFA
jgi:hypothetical protein